MTRIESDSLFRRLMMFSRDSVESIVILLNTTTFKHQLTIDCRENLCRREAVEAIIRKRNGGNHEDRHSKRIAVNYFDNFQFEREQVKEPETRQVVMVAQFSKKSAH
jgi:hypothetical protein